MDRQSLRAFREVARHGSITAAARSLGYTQSAVSRQISGLEQLLGVRLLDREARGVRVTAHGRLLLTHAEAVLERLDTAERELRALTRLDIGQLRVGAFPTANAVLVPSAMAAFGARHPEVRLVLREGTTSQLIQDVAADEVDVAVVSAFPGQHFDRDQLDCVRLTDDPMLLAVSQTHPLAGRESVRLRDLADERWTAGTSERTIAPWQWPNALGLTPDFVVGEWTSKLGLVAAGLAVTLVPALASPAIRADVALVPLDPTDSSPRAVYAVTVAGRTPPPAVAAFVNDLGHQTRRITGTRPESASESLET